MPLLGWDRVGREDANYKACIAVTSAAGAVIGGATGSFLGPVGTVGGYAGGAAWGFAAGFLACPYLVPAIKRKVEDGLFMSDAEVRSAAEAMGRYANLTQAADAVRLIGLLKGARLPSTVVECANPSFVAKQLLGKA